MEVGGAGERGGWKGEVGVEGRGIAEVAPTTGPRGGREAGAASDDAGATASSTHFPHHKLHTYTAALDALCLAKTLADRVPSGYRTFADQLLRAAGSVVLNTAEGANARTNGEKRQAFGVARKEAGEVASAAEALAVMGLIPKELAADFIRQQDRVAG